MSIQNEHFDQRALTPTASLPWMEWHSRVQYLSGWAVDTDSAYDAWIVGTTPTDYIRSLQPQGRQPMKHRGLILVLLAAVLILIVIKLAVHTALGLADLPQIPLVDGTVYLAAFLGAGAIFAWIDATA